MHITYFEAKYKIGYLGMQEIISLTKIYKEWNNVLSCVSKV